MEIVKNFGLDPFLFGAQVINFLVILYLLKRFLYKPILSILKKREDSIKEGLKQAEEARILLEETLVKEKQILTKARETARQTINDAKSEAIIFAQKIEEDSKKQAQKIIEEARVQIGLETQEAEKRLTTRISQLSVEVLESAIKEMFSEKDQKEVLDKAIKELGKQN